VRNFQKALDRLNYVQVNAVYGPDTIDYLTDTISFFVQLGAHVIHFNPNVCASWSGEAYSKLREVFTQIAKYYIESYHQGQEISVNFIDSKIILFLKGGYSVEDVCGMGETEWGFAPSGNIYPCERFIGEDNANSFCLGNVHTGLDLANRCSLLKKRGNCNNECKTCELQKFCMNWCGCTNYFMTGETDLAGPFLCAIEKASIQAAQQVFITLSKLDNELFIEHFYQYMKKGHNSHNLKN
jgi:uncharacterized protein